MRIDICLAPQQKTIRLSNVFPFADKYQRSKIEVTRNKQNCVNRLLSLRKNDESKLSEIVCCILCVVTHRCHVCVTQQRQHDYDETTTKNHPQLLFACVMLLTLHTFPSIRSFFGDMLHRHFVHFDKEIVGGTSIVATIINAKLPSFTSPSHVPSGITQRNKCETHRTIK